MEQVKDTHRVDVVKLGPIERLEGADKIGLAHVFGYDVVVEFDSHKPGDLVAYIPPDSVVDTKRPEFAFLDPDNKGKLKRVRVKKFNNFGVWSQGLVVPAPEGSNEGDEVAGLMGVTHYEPPMETIGGLKVRSAVHDTPPPGGHRPVYDLDSLRRHPDAFYPGELVLVSEKIHGCNARFTWQNDSLHVGTHRHWIKAPPERDAPQQSRKDTYWQAVEQNPWIERLCKKNTNWTLYGEIYGQVQKDFGYGKREGELGIALFDVWDHAAQAWVHWRTAYDFLGLTWHCVAPMVGAGQDGSGPVPYDFDWMKEQAEGSSCLDYRHVREGIVVRSLTDQRRRRVLKLVGNGYLALQGKNV